MTESRQGDVGVIRPSYWVLTPRPLQSRSGCCPPEGRWDSKGLHSIDETFLLREVRPEDCITTSLHQSSISGPSRRLQKEPQAAGDAVLELPNPRAQPPDTR